MRSGLIPGKAICPVPHFIGDAESGGEPAIGKMLTEFPQISVACPTERYRALS